MFKTALMIFLISIMAMLSIQAVAYGDDEKSQKRRGPPPFAELDLDGNGSLTLAEFQEHKIPRGDHETIFNHIDGDSDGIITEDEMKNHKPPRRQRN